ncbi:hypothetical protein V6N13_078820 [Hibiscus sabdariffa]
MVLKHLNAHSCGNFDNEFDSRRARSFTGCRRTRNVKEMSIGTFESLWRQKWRLTWLKEGVLSTTDFAEVLVIFTALNTFKETILGFQGLVSSLLFSISFNLAKVVYKQPSRRDKSMKYVETTIAVINCIGAPVCKYLGYHRNHDDYVRKFKSIRDELKCKTEDMELQLKAELFHPLGKITKKGVQNWLEKAKAMIVEAKGVENKVCNGRYLCRARNGKLVEEKTVEIQTLLDKAPNASESLVIDSPNVGFPLPTSELVGEKAVRDEIWKCLMEEEVSKIGVWGMGGVGKTTVMKHIHNDPLKESRFDKVIWVTISKDFNVIKLQDAIASALNLNGYLAEKSDEVIRAVILSAMLKRAGKHVLILDDVWDEFSLEEVGIPEPSSSNGCKMVLTTRSKQVCNRMGCKEMLVRPLSKEEALILFLSRVGPNTVQNKTIMPTLELVVNECDGLPLTIFVVAGCLKGENDAIIWKNALKGIEKANMDGERSGR